MQRATPTSQCPFAPQKPLLLRRIITLPRLKELINGRGITGIQIYEGIWMVPPLPRIKFVTYPRRTDDVFILKEKLWHIKYDHGRIIACKVSIMFYKSKGSWGSTLWILRVSIWAAAQEHKISRVNIQWEC